MDVNSIPYGEDFPEHLRQTVGQCQVVVAVIRADLAGVDSRAIAQRRDKLGFAQSLGLRKPRVSRLFRCESIGR